MFCSIALAFRFGPDSECSSCIGSIMGYKQPALTTDGRRHFSLFKQVDPLVSASEAVPDLGSVQLATHQPLGWTYPYLTPWCQLPASMGPISPWRFHQGQENLGRRLRGQMQQPGAVQPPTKGDDPHLDRRRRYADVAPIGCAQLGQQFP